MANHPFYAEKSGKAIEIKLFMDIHDIIDNIYKLPDVSKEALLSDASEVVYPKGFHLFWANRKSTKFYLMKKGMLHAYTHKSDRKLHSGSGRREMLFSRCKLSMIIRRDMRILNFWKTAPCMN